MERRGVVAETSRRLSPRTLEDLQDAVRSAEGIVIHGCGELFSHFTLPTAVKRWKLNRAATASTKTEEEFFHEFGFAPSNEDLPRSVTTIDLRSFNSILEFDASDQVVRVQAGMHATNTVSFEGEDTDLPAIQDELVKKGQCLPLWTEDRSALAFTSPGYDSLGFQASLNLPHILSAQCGSWRDWILGMTIVLADGTIARVGSKAVKNVAGYDLQKLMVGERGSLAIIAELTLKTFPFRALPSPSLTFGPCYPDNRKGPARWVQRVQREFFENAVAGCFENLFIADRESATLWCSISPDEDLPRYPGDWVIRSGCSEKNVQITDPTQVRLMKIAKEIFDPTNKLNPGEWGFM